uniref:Uncharacterized protein n=1 Tax=Arundo donax TaxID=35708 RepID=A0A0A9CUT3_ARUDO
MEASDQLRFLMFQLLDTKMLHYISSRNIRNSPDSDLKTRWTVACVGGCPPKGEFSASNYSSSTSEMAALLSKFQNKKFGSTL